MGRVRDGRGSYTNEGSNHIALKIPVAEIKADEYTVDEWAEEIEEIALSDADSKCLDNIVNQIL